MLDTVAEDSQRFRRDLVQERVRAEKLCHKSFRRIIMISRILRLDTAIDLSIVRVYATARPKESNLVLVGYGLAELQDQINVQAPMITGDR